MVVLSPIKLKTKKDFNKAIEAYRAVLSFSESELETLEILSNQKDKDLILRGIRESKSNKIHPVKSIFIICLMFL